MIIDELFEIKNKKIEEHKKNFPDVEQNKLTLEMFEKKYDESYYTNYHSYTIQPFINQIFLSKTNFWDDEHFDAKNMPRLKDKKYNEIRNFPDYDYINSIAYEMLIRTSEYINLRDKNNDCYEIKIKKFDQLGIDINDVFDLKKIEEHYSEKVFDKNFTNSYFSMTLNDLEQGLNRLIDFYLTKNKIHVIDNIEKIVLNKEDEINKKEIVLGRTFKIASNVKNEEIKVNLSNYFIPVKYNYKMPNLLDNFIAIDENIPLVTLEKDFLLSIDDLIPNRIKGAIDFNFTRPLLRFKELPIVDVPLNLNLSINELTQLVTKLKEDFEIGLVKNPINILYDVKFKIENLKDITPFKMTKETIAEAFFIYDLYQYIEATVILHKEKIKHLKNFDKKEIENQTILNIERKKHEINNSINELKEKKDKKVDKWVINNYRNTLKIEIRKLQKEKNEKINKINKQYKSYTKDYHSITILECIAKLHNITPYICKQYLKFIRIYIKDLKYKELIVGKKIKT